MMIQFPFFNLPFTIKDRFAELCDAPTLINLRKIFPTENLAPKRKLIQKAEINHEITNLEENQFQTLSNFDKSLEILYLFRIVQTKINRKDVNGIITNYYTRLSIVTGILELETINYLIGPKVNYLFIYLKINGKDDKKFDEKFKEFVDRLILIETIDFHLLVESPENLEYIKTQIMRLSDNGTNSPGVIHSPNIPNMLHFYKNVKDYDVD